MLPFTRLSARSGSLKMASRPCIVVIAALACLATPSLSLGQNARSQRRSEDLKNAKKTPKNFPRPKPYSPNDSIYYKNKLEFSLECGWLPINIPFPFDVFLGDVYDFPGLDYTLVPTLASLRWQMSDVTGPPVLRGNWDLTFTGAFTAIPRGAETHYLAYDMGLRYNFVPRYLKTAPYFDFRTGLGRIDAKGPLGVPYAQGQDFTFTLMMGSGIRYNFNSKYSIEAGLNWMHVSNAYLSQPKYLDYGINVYGPMFGFNVRLGRPKGHAH